MTLTAVADNDSTFVGWDGACTNTLGDCVVTIDQAQNVTATFSDEYFNFLPLVITDVVTTDEDMAIIINVLANDSDPDGDVLTVESVTQPTNGEVGIVNNHVVYSPTLNFNGDDVFNYTVHDGNDGRATGVVSVTVASINDTPIISCANETFAVTLPSDATLSCTVMDDGTPPDPGLVTTQWSQLSGPGMAVFADNASATTTVSFSVDGTYVLQLMANDGELSTTTEVTVTVLSVNAVGTINTRVWDDRNGDGKQNEGSNVAGVTVELLDGNGESFTPAIVAVTDTKGRVTLTASPGNYQLRYHLPADHAFTTQDKQGVPEHKDSDADVINGRTATFTLDADQKITTIDAGMWTPGQVEARVWDDRDGDGKQDEGSNITGVVVHLLESDGTPVPYPVGHPQAGQIVTGASNNRGIATLYVPADRLVKLEFVLPADHMFTHTNQERVREHKDSDADKVTGMTGLFQASKGSETYKNWDAGLWTPGQIEARVWHDKDGDGKQDESSNVANVVVNLLEADNSPVINPNTNTAVSTLSNNKGIAALDYVPSDRPIKLEFVIPDGYSFTEQDKVEVPEYKDSDADPITGMTDAFQVSKGNQTFKDWDAGLQ